MNLFKNLINRLTESSFEDLVLQFVVTRLQTDSACLVVTDNNQKAAYEVLLKRLRGVNGNQLELADTKLVHHSLAEEFIIVHSNFDHLFLTMLLEPVNACKRIIYVAETVCSGDVTHVGAIQGSTDVEIVFAYQDMVQHRLHSKFANTQDVHKMFGRDDL